MQVLPECKCSYKPFLWNVLLMYNPNYNLTLFFILFSVICFSVSVLSFWLRFEKVCCIKASPTGEGSFSLECFRTQEWSSDALSNGRQRPKLRLLKPNLQLQQFLKSKDGHIKWLLKKKNSKYISICHDQYFIQFIYWCRSLEFKTAQMYRSVGVLCYTDGVCPCSTTLENKHSQAWM